MSSYPWRQRVIPRDLRSPAISEAYMCKLTGFDCGASSCPRFMDFNVWSRGRHDCEHKEAQA